ncbi:Hypothetical protein P9301_16081 [Prochlorococcus marinus str. MIT 9301]|jgi:YHS domain-containing protein|uniref:YHS domain-containing protein n=2 Tax=Prochlorococcaceae TaxID=2881426 RepID=A3PEQ6_PROM0|nr:Hypothetical protein P9301_16081 [Prochlorococcus marinus str. MIT 9301]
MGLMKRLLLTLLLFASPVLAEKYTIYTTERPPSSWSGIIDSEGYYYWFTNGIPPAEKHKCDILSQGCWIKTNEKAEIISKDIIKVNRYGTERYFCSEEHIQAVNKANPKPTYLRYSSHDHGYGKCTKDGWVR